MRFPLASKIILNNLDNQSLVRSKESSRKVAEFVDGERFIWIRIIKKYSQHFEGFEESWNEVINKTPVNILKQFAISAQKFFKYYRSTKKVAPLHIAAVTGSFQVCKHIVTKTRNNKTENPFSPTLPD